MAVDFPNSPTSNQVFQSNGKTWQWDGEKWVLTSSETNITVLTALDDQVILAMQVFS